MLVSAINVPPIMLNPRTGTGNVTTPGNYMVTWWETGIYVFNVDFSAGPGGPLDINSPSIPVQAQVDANYG